MSVVLALDYGVKKMGVAVGNTVTQTAQPLDILPMNNGQPDWQALLTLIVEWQVELILVGLPVNMDGSESHLSKRATKFAKRLNHQLKEQRIAKKINLVDERLSSFEARHSNVESYQKSSKHMSKQQYNAASKMGKKTQQIDDRAACILLTTWFDNAEGMELP